MPKSLHGRASLRRGGQFSGSRWRRRMPPLDVTLTPFTRGVGIVGQQAADEGACIADGVGKSS